MVFLSALSNPGWEVWVQATVSVLQKPPLPLSTFMLVSCLGNLAMSLAVDYHPFRERVIIHATESQIRYWDVGLRFECRFYHQLIYFQRKICLSLEQTYPIKTTYVMFADFVVILHSMMKVMQTSLHRSWKESMNLIHRTGKH